MTGHTMSSSPPLLVAQVDLVLSLTSHTCESRPLPPVGRLGSDRRDKLPLPNAFLFFRHYSFQFFSLCPRSHSCVFDLCPDVLSARC